MGSFPPEETRALELANVITSAVSIMGSLFIIACYLYLRELRTFAFRLVFMVAISDVFFSIGCFLGDAGGAATHVGSGTGLCLLQALLISYFQLSSFFWAVSIAFTLHMAFLKEKESFSPHHIGAFEPYYHLVCWGIPLFLTFLPFFTDSYGDTGGWCWIKNETAGDSAMRFIQFYAWLWAGIIYTAVIFRFIYVKIRALQRVNGDQAAGSTANRLKLYPVVLVFCHTAGSIAALYEAFSGGQMVFWLNMLQVITAASMGFCNACVYGLTPEVAQQVCRVIPCGRLCKHQRFAVAPSEDLGQFATDDL